MRIWGATLFIVGVGSFVMPMLGYQFIVVRVFGRHGWMAALGLIVIGLGLLVASFRRKRVRKEAPARTAE